jgi:predicted DNA-binding WGR domain protein
MRDTPPLLRILETGLAHGGLQTDDVMTLVLPLFQQVAALHQQERVAELAGAASLAQRDDGALALARPEGLPPRLQRAAIERLQAPVSSVLQVVGEHRITIDDALGLTAEDLAVADTGEPGTLTRPVYLPHYTTWEAALGHHDAVSDILVLGQVLASLACGLDFTQPDELRSFARERDNLFRLQPRLHPVVGSVILEMTELDRRRRAKDLPSLIQRLQTYRDQPQDLRLDRLDTAADSEAQRRSAVQAHLRDRLFDLSRRNRLLHFKPTQSAVNLTVASVPLVVDLKSIRTDQLCQWGGRFAQAVLSNARVPLLSWLRFEDQPYLPGALDRLIQEARRDRAEYGFSQLSLVVAFLHWHNLKEAPEERIASPLLLLPVELSRKKGVRDQYVLQAETDVAEVNPVLRQQLRLVYGIELPETLDLGAEGSIASFHALLLARIASSEPGVQLRLQAEPQIELIHQRARQRLEQFRRRRKELVRPSMAAMSQTDYSYAADDYRPLGLKWFTEHVRPAPLPLRSAVGGTPAPRHPQMAAAAGAAEAEHTTYALRGNSGNPYQWDIDLAAVTLGNFNYRKMSLVRDYNALVEGEQPNPAFDRVFSSQPRRAQVEVPAPPPLADQWPVVAADATQTAAVTLARGGDSYIIQGPPGTGKSQTITNLIADYIGRGKRVLFVCEKRAAIDVVFHRLRQQGLDELCCLIHDSQADKKAFVLNLKQTYEHWLAAEDGHDGLQRERSNTLAALQQDLEALQRFDAAMRSVPAGVGTRVRQLVHRLVALREHRVALDPRQAEALPDYEAWLAHGGLAERLQQALQETLGTASLARHVFARLGEGVIRHEHPVSRLATLTDAAEPGVDRCVDALTQAWPDAPPLLWGQAEAVLRLARELAPLAERGQLALLDGASAASRELDQALAELATLQQALEGARTKTTGWHDRLSALDTAAALEQARAQEGGVLRWLQPSWWRLRGQLQARYDFASRAVKPTLVAVLSDLAAEHDATARLAQAQEALAARHGVASLQAQADALQQWREAASSDATLATFHRHVLSLAQGDAARAAVATLSSTFDDASTLAPLLQELLTEPQTLALAELGELVRDLREQADGLPELLPLLRELGEADPALARALRQLPLPAAGLEYAIAHESLERVYRVERWLPRFDGVALARHAERLEAGERTLLGLNARTLRAAVRQRFAERVRASQLAAGQLDEAGKQFKKSYSAGRRELEHEFGKTMRYRSIRDLSSGDTGQVVRDMKPIWLMSPLSVSDTLPLTSGLFDVVVFDEASQITVEDAVPALSRAPQVIIVGDEMQLPPTGFFSSGRSSDDGDGEADEAQRDGERLSVVLDADSLLNQGARNLQATLLSWHYRSRSESLIGFSNAAFYAGNLYTIPDRTALAGQREPLLMQGPATPEAVAAHTQALLARPISFHALPQGVYENRRNATEATYIAHLVRELLALDTGRSIGIVAFSEAQQGEIEDALASLAAEDETFATRLETEYVKEEDDQFCGLFVKNLENVQGDERDIIILSICYAPGPNGRMLMNFGPINQRGGEKRLNVIFSRARHHMAVVSSIRHEAITNDYNDGAAALKQFLRYAEYVSGGQRDLAQRVLEGLNPATRKALTEHLAPDQVLAQLADALRARGHQVDEQVGQSRFRCDLALRGASSGDGGEAYQLGVMIDTDAHYANPNVLERYVSRPRILSAFGWRVVQVLSRDWLQDPEAVLDRIERALRGEPVTEPEAPPSVETAEAAPAPPAVEPPLTALTATVPPAGPGPRMRQFELVEGTARRFWHIGQDGIDVVVSFGRLGTRGQTQVKPFANAQRATREVDKLIAEKLKKGYLEVTS